MTDPESTTTGSDQRSDLVGWLLIGTMGVAALFLAYVHAPQRVKLPLLSPVALGALAGWGLGRWANARGVSARRIVSAAAFVLIAGGQVGAAIEAHRVGAPAIRAELNRRNSEFAPAADQIEQALIEESPDEATRARLQAEHEDAQRRRKDEFDRQQRLLTFAGYLESRVPRQWGHWPAPWPELFWGAEIFLASTIGAWFTWRFAWPPASGGREPPEAQKS